MVKKPNSKAARIKRHKRVRAKISGTVVEKMAEMGILGDLPETDQMSLLDFMA